MEECIFCKIIKNEIPSTKIYEDNDTLAFLDINPISKGHSLVITKKHYETFNDIDQKDFVKISETIKKVSKAIVNGVSADAWNLGMNNGKDAGQLVMHAHFHLIPRFKGDGLKHWPGSNYQEGEIEKVREEIIKYL